MATSEPLLQADAKEDGKKEDRFAVARAAGNVCMWTELNDQMMFTFLSSWLVSQGVSRSRTGMGYIAIALGFIISFPLLKYLLGRFPANKIQYYASYGFIGVRLTMMCLPFVPNHMLFSCFVGLAFLLGLVAATIESAGSSWAMISARPEDRVEAMGILISERVKANIIAPAVGGCLYSLGGFCLPFFVGASSFLAYMIAKKDVLLSMTPPKDQSLAAQTGSILKNPIVLLGYLLHVLVFGVMLSVTVWQPPFLLYHYSVAPWAYGVILSGAIVPFIIGASTIGGLQTKLGLFKAIYVGVACQILGNLLMGPSPLLSFLPQPSLQSVYLPILSIFFTQISLGMIVVSLGPMCINAAVAAGWAEHDASTQHGMYSVVILGASLGVTPPIAGHVCDLIGAPWWSTMVGFIYLLGVVPVYALMDCLDAKNPKEKQIATVVATKQRTSENSEGKTTA